MNKRITLYVVIILTLLSFPFAAFGSESAPSVTTVSVKDIGPGSATLMGSTTRDGLSERGFDYGLTTNYGDRIKNTEALSSYSYVSQFGTVGTGEGQFNNPNAIAFDTQGNYWVADSNNNRIQKFDSTGNFIFAFGQEGLGSGAATPGTFNWIADITVDSQNNLYVVNEGNHRVDKFDSQGNFLLTIGGWGPCDNCFRYPQSIEIDSNGDVVVIDIRSGRNYSTVKKFNSSGQFISKFGSYGTGDGQFEDPTGLAFDATGNIYISDQYNHRIIKFDSSGIFVSQFGSYGTGDGQFNYPQGIAIDSTGNIFVADTYNHRIQKFDASGLYLARFGAQGSGDGQLSYPTSLIVDSSNIVWVVDNYNNRIQKFVADGASSTYSEVINKLVCESTYHYRAYATNDVGTSYGDDKTFITAICSPGPTGIVVTASATKASISWDAIENHQGYRVAYKRHDSAVWTTIDTYEDTVPTSITGLDSDTQYDFRVSYRDNQDIYSGWSDVVNATTTTQVTYPISTCRQLQAIGEDPVTHVQGDMEGNYVLTNNIDCSESVNWTWDKLSILGLQDFTVTGFMPIFDIEGSNNQESDHETPKGFSGTFDGGGFRVSHISQSTGFISGIFGFLEGATIKNVVFDDTNIELTAPQSYAAGLASMADSHVVIDHVTMNGSIVRSASGSNQPILRNVSNFAFGPTGEIYILQSYGNNGSPMIIKTASDGTVISSFAVEGSGDGQLNNPRGIAVDSLGNVYVSDQYNNRVVKFDSSGNFVSKFGSSGSGDGELQYPRGIAVDSLGNVYVSDQYNNRVVKFDSSGNFVSKFGSSGSGDGELSRPNGISVDSLGNVYVVDEDNSRVVKFDSSGNFVSKFGSSGTGDGQYRYPQGIGVDSSDNVYVLDNDKGIVKFDSSSSYLSTIGQQESFVYSGAMVAVAGVFSYSDNPTEATSLVITNSSTNMTMDLSADSVIVGGMTGYGVSFVAKSSSAGKISVNIDHGQGNGEGSYVGGLLGYAEYGSILDSYSNSKIIIGDQIDAAVVGGLVGSSRSTSIERSYSSGDILISDTDTRVIAGGIIGNGSFHDNGKSVGSVKNSLSTSRIYSTSPQGINSESMLGAIAGSIELLSTEVFSGNIFDATRTGITSCGNFNDADQGNSITPTEQMCHGINVGGDDSNYVMGNSSSHPYDTWDFVNVWQTNKDALPTFRTIPITTDTGSGPGGGGGSGDDSGSKSGDTNVIPPDPNLNPAQPKPQNGNSNLSVSGTGTQASSNTAIPALPEPSILSNVKAKVLGETDNRKENSQATPFVPTEKSNTISNTMFKYLIASSLLVIATLAFGWWILGRRKKEREDTV